MKRCLARGSTFVALFCRSSITHDLRRIIPIYRRDALNGAAMLGVLRMLKSAVKYSDREAVRSATRDTAASQ